MTATLPAYQEPSGLLKLIATKVLIIGCVSLALIR